MHSSARDGAHQDNWRRGEHQGSVLSSSSSNEIPPVFTQEYRLLSEVCAGMSSGFLLLNTEERITYSNPSAQRLLCVQRDATASTRLSELNIRQHLLNLAVDPQKARADLEQVWQHRETEASTDLALLDAAVYWLRLRCFPVRDERGHLLGHGLLLDDITLERSASDARSETLSMAAHELKTPLAIIKGCATTLLGGSARWDPAMQREMLQMIDTQSDRLYDMLNTLLDVWRFDAGAQQLRLAQIPLPELLLQLLKRWQKQALEYQFILDLPPDVPPVVCDALRIEHVLNHLLNNAVTNTPAGKVIRLQVETNEFEVRVSVMDEGVGIASEHLERIFERFYRIQPDQDAALTSLSESKAHSGLGLAAARATIEAHGGKIWADSSGLGEGATFYFTLPFAPHPATITQSLPALTEAALAARQNTGRLPAMKQDRRPRVLLAEADARIARYIRANLEEQQYRVQVVNHGIQFLRQVDLEVPDLVILSTRLNDMGGMELLQRLREFAQMPVLMLCDACDEDERVQLFDLGADDLVMKPFGIKEMLARLRALLRRQSPPAEQSQAQSIFVAGDLLIDYAQHQVTVQGRAVQLSRTEYKLLSTLAQNVGMVVTHELLLEKVWGPEYNRDIDFIWVYISRLRRKIEADSRHPKYILTVPDVGYKLAKL
jgi:DNA-binding response OmpR family regulator/signal transduction histidine kinase